MIVSTALALVAQAALALPSASAPAYAPVTHAVRGTMPRIEAQLNVEAERYAPLVFARVVGERRFHGYPMVERRGNKWVARLPAAITSGASFEYFVETRAAGGAAFNQYGSADAPFVVTIDEPTIRPAMLSVASDTAGVSVLIDGKEVGKAPLDIQATPGRHIVGIAAADGRGAEQSVEAQQGKTRKLMLVLPSGGPGTLTLSSEPSGARVSLDDKVIGVTPYVGTAVAGDHRLTVERAGYLRQARDVSWRAGHDVELAFSLVPLPKDPALVVESTPAGATVVIDGAARGVSPWTGALSKGPHQVVLKLAGRREVASDFTMPEGRDLSLRLELPPAVKNALPRLVVGSKPDSATLTIDGEAVGETPWAGEVKPGKHKVSLSLKGYIAEERTVDAKPNREQEVSFALQHEAGPAQVTVVSQPEGVQLQVDGSFVGRTPLAEPLTLQPGEHQLEASKDGFKAVAQSMTLEQGQHLALQLALAPVEKEAGPPVIAVNTEPKGAKLYVDNKAVGETPTRVKSVPGVHEIRLVLDGYISRHAKITLPDGKDFELRVAVTLKPERGSDDVAAPDARALARARLKHAQNCYAQGDWACALAGFQAAYDYKAVPELLFNIAQARRKKGDFKECAAAYRSYVKAAPSGPLAKAAEQFAERCDKAAAGGESAVSDDDTRPPVIAHQPLLRALRGDDVKVSAHIVDDKSGVYAPQLCWRNSFTADYECAALLAAGGDEFAVVVPARAVADGFSYYIEAFDNAGNGPARSGTPMAPHQVPIEDKAVPQARQIVAREIPQEEIERRARELAQTMTSLHNAPAPVENRPWNLVVHLGAEQARERYTDSVVGGRSGLELTRRFSRFQTAMFEAGAWTTSQPYRTRAPVPGQPAPAQGLSEQRYTLAGSWGLDAAEMLHLNRLDLTPMATVSYQRFQNQAFPVDYLGAGAQVRTAFHALSWLNVVGGAGYTWNLLKNTERSAVGAPRSDTFASLGVSLPIAGSHALEVCYRGDLLALVNDYRVSNGVTAGFGSSF